MHRPMWTLILLLVASPLRAPAQSPPPKAPTLPIMVADPAIVAEEIAGVYRRRPMAERIAIRVTTPTGTSERQSVLLHAEPAKPDPPVPVRLHLDLSRLELWLHGRDCTLTNRADPTTYFQVGVGEPASFDTLFREIRPIPLPQIAWCLGDPPTRPLGSMLGDVAWSTVQPKSASTSELVGRAESGEVKIVFDQATRRVRAFTARLPRGIVLELTCSPANGTPWTNWSPDLSGRTRVDALASLQSTAPTATIGQRLPSVAFITTNYEGWVLPKSSDREPLFVLFVRTGASGEAGPELHARVGTLIRAVRTRLPTGSEHGAAARLVLVGVLASGTTHPENLARYASAWIDVLHGPPAPPVWTTADWSLIAGAFVEADVVLHVVASDRKVIATVACDPSDDEKQVEDRLREALRKPQPPADPSKE